MDIRSVSLTFFIRILAAGILLLFISCTAAEDQCTDTPTPRVKVHIISRRNKTGYWSAQVELEHGGDTEEEYGKDTGDWDLDIVHSTDRCGDAEKIRVLASITAPPQRAGPNYELVPGLGYYKLHSGAAIWEEARKTCIKEGAHLIVINSEQESKVVQQLFVNNPVRLNATTKDFAMVGFHDRFQEGQYLTIFGDPLANTGFSRWSHAGQPDNGRPNPPVDPDSDCGGVYINGGLNDVPCHWSLAFICEQELW